MIGNEGRLTKATRLQLCQRCCCRCDSRRRARLVGPKERAVADGDAHEVRAEALHHASRQHCAIDGAARHGSQGGMGSDPPCGSRRVLWEHMGRIEMSWHVTLVPSIALHHERGANGSQHHQGAGVQPRSQLSSARNANEG